MAYMIVPDLCTACGACEFECPNSAISVSGSVYAIDATKCKECEGEHDSPQCALICPITDCCVPANAS